MFIWWRQDAPRLRAEARDAIARADLVYVSAASAWEAALKVALGKLRIPGPFEEAVADSHFTKLLIDFDHAAAAAGLPAHHTDPFDRMLIAQARLEGLTIVTHDRNFGRYEVPLIWT